ncbi:nuclear nucleic acid-binding protein C1D [Teleopsis dalmanni]|uniref:nuclear nucleic acid-binding protein C1D n=1 Tax=Teleopsis dalmanni TaxID=139649 RepID=UPI0018CEF533|nr:nuclear nucleic acid-binding protein C1D [Teleopsis dalmanni]
MDENEMDMDEDVIAMENLEELKEALKNIESTLPEILEYKSNDKISLEEKIKIDNYLLYAVNSLFFIYLKLQGLSSEKYDVKFELTRVKETLVREKQIHDHKTIRPVLDKGAAKRFIKHGLKIPRIPEKKK